MSSENLTLVTVIAPESMEEPIANEMLALGATGYTAWTVRGRGIHGARPSTWTGANVRVETAVSEEVAQRIVARLHAQLSEAVALKIFTTTTLHHR